MSRSNYFEVKDVEAFKTALAVASDIKVKAPGPEKTADLENGTRITANMVALFDEGDGWPFEAVFSEDEEIEFDLVSIIADHLVPGEVAVLMETAFSGERYNFGAAVAITCEGMIRQISLADIYEAVAGAAHADRPVTEARM